MGFSYQPNIDWSQDDLSFLQGVSSFEGEYQAGEFLAPLADMEPDLRDEADTQDYLFWSRNLDNMSNDLKRMTIQGLVNLVIENLGDVGGVPAGGTTGQILVKQSSTDGDVAWEDQQDLSGYVTTGALTTALSSYVTNSALTSTLSSYVTNSSLTSTLAGYVPTSRTLSTTSPVRIGGGASADLSANRTLSWDFSVANTWTGAQTFSNTTTTTPVDAWVAGTTSVATVGNQKASSTIRWSASGWKTNSVAGAQSLDYRVWVLPEQGILNPSGIWKLQSQVNGGGYSDRISFDDKLGGKGFTVHGYNQANGGPGTTRLVSFENSGSYSWLDFNFSGTRRSSIGANASGGLDLHMTGGNYLALYSSGNTLYSYNYPSAFVHYYDGYFGGRVHAGAAGYPSSTLKSYGSVALGKGIRVTANYTLTVNDSAVYADASTAACSGTPTYACNHWTNQTDCEKWDAHGGCSWFAGYSCSTYNGDQSGCEGQSGCTYETASCSGFGDESSCNGQSGCSWTNNPQSCSGFDEYTCGSTSGCYMNYDYCYNYSDGGGDGTACGTVSGHGCSYDSGSGSCSDGMGDSGWFSSCGGTYDSYSCTGTYFTGTCSGTYGAVCQGTSSCSGIDDSTNCGFETGCTWSTAITLNLPQLITCPDRDYWIYNASSTNADVIIQPYSGDNIDHTTSFTLANYKDAIHIKAYYETTSCGSFNEGACTPSGCSPSYSNCSWDSMSSTCSGDAVCTGIGDQSTCEATTYFSYCAGSYYVVKNWYVLSRS